jgi:hypothetical protein
VVALGLYLFMQAGRPRRSEPWGIGSPLFTFADNVEFFGCGQPGERVVVMGRRSISDRLALKTQAVMERENGERVCSGGVGRQLAV